MPRGTLTVVLFALAAMAAGGCGDDRDTPAGGEAVRAVATTTHAADLLENVGGARVAVHTLLGRGADPHDYEPRPSDARSVAGADLVVRSGGEVDEWLADLLDAAGGDARRVTLIDSVERLGDDPHWWQDPRNAIRGVDALREALVEVDPAGRETYERNAERYTARLDRLDRAIAGCMGRIPRERRKLVTTHDALAYYARRYEIELVGALIPSSSTQGQPSAGETARLVRQIEREGVTTIFPESALDPRLERAVAREAGVRVGPALWTDSLGPPGSPGATFIGALAANTEALAKAFGGGRSRCVVEAT